MPFLQFKGKTAVEMYHHSLPHHSFEFDAELSLSDGNQPSTVSGNLIIEGDNLLALKALLPTHSGKVKCIYIDPPYNTGNEGWIYNDNLTQPVFKEWIGQVVGNDETDSSRHDKWCCMIYPRLQLIKEMLTPDGVLLVSIDDNEVSSLRLILDEIFGVDKFMATFVWRRRVGSSMASSWVSADHEYVLAYSMDPENTYVRGDERDMTKYNVPDGTGRFYASMPLTVGMTKSQRPNQWYELVNPATGTGYWPQEGRVWGYYPPTMAQKIAEGRIIWPEDFPDRKMTRPRYKAYPEDAKRERKPLSTFISERGVKPDIDEEANSFSVSTGKNEEGTRILKDLLGETNFPYPKPLSLVKSLVQQFTRDGDIVLDSFAGSGTTGHAVLQANEEDGESRTFILIQQKFDNKDNEKDGYNICRDVTAQRVRRVIEGVNSAPLPGYFAYARLSEKPLLGEYRDLGDTLPPYEEIARYVFFTETSDHWDSEAVNRETGRIGQHKGTAYYLLYTPNGEEDGTLDRNFLRNVAAQEECTKLVVYCEKFWMHRDELREWEALHGKSVRHMLVPFNLK